jgi:hypothetical protein
VLLRDRVETNHRALDSTPSHGVSAGAGVSVGVRVGVGASVSVGVGVGVGVGVPVAVGVSAGVSVGVAVSVGVPEGVPTERAHRKIGKIRNVDFVRARSTSPPIPSDLLIFLFPPLLPPLHAPSFAQTVPTTREPVVTLSHARRRRRA